MTLIPIFSLPHTRQWAMRIKFAKLFTDDQGSVFQTAGQSSTLHFSLAGGLPSVQYWLLTISYSVWVIFLTHVTTRVRCPVPHVLLHWDQDPGRQLHKKEHNNFCDSSRLTVYRFHAKLSSRRNGQKACVKNIGQAETADDIGFAKRHFVKFLKIAERSATLQDSLTKQKRDAATGSVNHARNFTEKILTRPGRAPSCRFALVRRA